MKVLKNVVAIALMCAFIFSFVACTNSKNVSFTKNDFFTSAEEVLGTANPDGYSISYGGYVIGQQSNADGSDRAHYEVDYIYLADNGIENGISLEFYEFEDKKSADMFFEDMYKAFCPNGETDSIFCSYNEGQSGYYSYPKKSDWDFKGLYYCGNYVFAINAVTEDGRTNAIKLLDKMDLPHV